MVEAKELLETLRLQTLGVTVRDVQVKALVEKLAATLAKVEAETFYDTQSDLDAEVLFEDVADKHEELEA